MRGLYWFRTDLRVEDNAALFAAAEACTEGLIAVYCIPYQTWKKHHTAACKVDFILRHLPSLSQALSQLNIPLQIEIHPTFKDSAHKIAELATHHQVQTVYCNREYEWDERQRDLLLSHLLAPDHITLHLFDDSVIVPPGKVLTGKGSPYTVFTPFKKATLIYLSRPDTLTCPGMPTRVKHAFAKSSAIPDSVPGFKSSVSADRWPAGLEAAKARLDHFIATGLASYADQRNIPSIDGTSQLSPYLHIGALSVKRCYVLGQSSPAWTSELLWRDFYKHVSFNFPHVCKGHSFHQEYDKMKWLHDEKAIAAWKAGETGFPLVDAAMKQLVQTGWMHNRLRMLVAIFFCKLMYQDWRIGEQFFMEHLIDGDFSSNNGGWQWSSATGTDAAPYFRIFNPKRQSEEYDPEGTFIRQYLPELDALSARDIHAPPSEMLKKLGYPAPLLEYEKARKLSLARFLAFKKETR